MLNSGTDPQAGQRSRKAWKVVPADLQSSSASGRRQAVRGVVFTFGGGAPSSGSRVTDCVVLALAPQSCRACVSMGF